MSSLFQWVSILSPAAGSWDARLSAFVLLLLLPSSVIMGDVYSFTKGLLVILNFVMSLSVTQHINPVLYKIQPHHPYSVTCHPGLDLWEQTL